MLQDHAAFSRFRSGTWNHYRAGAAVLHHEEAMSDSSGAYPVHPVCFDFGQRRCTGNVSIPVPTPLAPCFEVLSKKQPKAGQFS
jgi:hypothetical protein